VAKHGDPARGEAIYRRRDQLCQKCHAIAGAGGQVGPDLTSIGASAQVDYLIESILLPNKAIKENYHSLNVATKDGRLLAGIPVRQTEKELVLRDAEDREVEILLRDVEAKEQGGSLMPEGLADLLTRAELVDLVRFLSELGKVGPFSPGQARVVRRWQVLTSNSMAKGNQLLPSGPPEAPPSDHPAFNWTPVYSTVNGELPTWDLQSYGNDNWGPWVFVRFQLDVTSRGTVKLVLNSKDISIQKFWLDGKSVEFKEEMVGELKEGLHTVTMAVRPHPKHDRLRVELVDVPASPARVRIVGGK